ncbi:MAG: hypothetical protein ED557_01155 [Balneola sp.]|nr:MAG: hypothetical protein ED557_01155 [Balneola sp.]
MKFKLFIICSAFALLINACDSTSGNKYEEPELEINNPASGSFIYGSTTIEVELLNPESSNVSEIAIIINDSQIGALSEAPYEFEFDSEDFPNGETSITVIATSDGEEYETVTSVVINNALGEIYGDWMYTTSTTRFYENDVLVNTESVDMSILDTVYGFERQGDLKISVGFSDTVVVTQYEIIDGMLQLFTDPESDPIQIEWKAADQFNLITDNGEYIEDGILKREEMVSELYRDLD